MRGVRPDSRRHLLLALFLFPVACRSGRVISGSEDTGAGGAPTAGAGGRGGQVDAGSVGGSSASGGSSGSGGSRAEDGMGGGAGGIIGGGAGGIVGSGGHAAGGAPGAGGISGSGGKPGTGGMASSPAALAGSASNGYGLLEVGVSSPAFTWSVSNLGDAPTPAPVLTNGDASELIVTNLCTAAIAAHSSCTVQVAFRPAALGVRSGSLTLDAGSAGQATFAALATGAYRITIAKTGTGTGTVTTNTGEIACGTTCTALIGTPVVLRARTSNGSSSFFSGWSGGGCAGPGRDCTLTPAASVTITATFSPMTSNLIFVTSNNLPTDRGSAAAYDGDCNAAATAAGINDGPGAAFTAMISDANSLGRARLGATARGWVRMDGKPFADTQAGLFGSQVIFNDVRFDETGRPFNTIVMTGTNSDGTLTSLATPPTMATCQNWTVATNQSFFAGSGSLDGAGGWLSISAGEPCNVGGHVLCMGHTKNSAVSALVSSGKFIWLSTTLFTPGTSLTPDAACQASRPGGVTASAALIATTTRSAATVLDMSASYVRPDGTFVATGAQMAATPAASATATPDPILTSGVWQFGDGTYLQPQGGSIQFTWTGQTTLTSLGTVASTCGNWTDPNQTGFVGFPTETTYPWWNNVSSIGCTRPLPIYCVQTAP